MSSTTLIEQTETLVDAIARQHAEERHRAFTQYRELLLKNHKPIKADGERLRSLLDELRLDPSDMRRDLAVLQEAQRHEATAASFDAAQAVYDEANQKATKHKRETARIVKQRGEQQAQLDDERMETMCKVKDICLAGKLRDRLHAEHAELFGVQSVETDDVASVV